MHVVPDMILVVVLASLNFKLSNLGFLSAFNSFNVELLITILLRAHTTKCIFFTWTLYVLI